MGITKASSKPFLHYSVLVVFAAVLLAAIGRYTIESSDRTRCHGMLNDGYWLDKKDTEWQPSGCMMHHYKTNDAAECLKNSQVLYIGDSIMREQYYSMVSFVQQINKNIPLQPLHIDQTHVYRKANITFDFWWDPYVNSKRTLNLLSGKDMHNKPTLLVMGTGIWYMESMGKDYLENWKVTIDGILKAVERKSDADHQIADAMILSPVEITTYPLLNKDRQTKFSYEKEALMNNYLKQRDQTLEPSLPFGIAFAWNAIATAMPNATSDGLHFQFPVTHAQAELALNFRCNDQLPKTPPMDATCCMHYPAPQWYQNAWLVFFFVLVPLTALALFLTRFSNFGHRFIPSSTVLFALFVFGLSVGYMYFCDRTHVFSKAHKHFDADTFLVFMLVIFFGSTVALETAKQRDNETAMVDAGFLNRAQTDEWKGWMQMIILAYHYTGASGTPSIYHPIRVLVAAYLFQTGYGHFCYFYRKADYSFSRVLQVLVRLNLLTFVLQYVMATNYLGYYFAPLVSFWFLVVWLTMLVGHPYNTKVWFLLGKITLMGVLTTMLIHREGVLEALFGALAWLFRVRWNASDWRFRMALDAFIVYAGMLVAYAYILCAEHKLHMHAAWPHVKRTAVIASCGALGWYIWFEVSQPSKQVYNQRHPFLSWIPILAYIVLRNATVSGRNTTSRFCVWVGRCSLETFIGQYHMWLAADTNGLLVVLAESQWYRGLGWWANVSLSTVLFFFVCHHLSQATNQLAQWLSTSSETTPKADYSALPLLPMASPDDQIREYEDQGTRYAGEKQPSCRRKLLVALSDKRLHVSLFILSVGVFNRYC